MIHRYVIILHSKIVHVHKRIFQYYFLPPFSLLSHSRPSLALAITQHYISLLMFHFLLSTVYSQTLLSLFLSIQTLAVVQFTSTLRVFCICGQHFFSAAAIHTFAVVYSHSVPVFLSLYHSAYLSAAQLDIVVE